MVNEMKAGQDTLNSAAKMVSAAKGDFDKLAANLRDQISQAQARWQGQGGNAFQNLGTQWNERQNKVVAALNQFEASLTQTQATNTNTDSNQSSFMNKINGRLGDVQNF